VRKPSQEEANGGTAVQREEMRGERGGWDLEEFHVVGGWRREQPAFSSRPRGGPRKEEVGVPSSYPARERLWVSRRTPAPRRQRARGPGAPLRVLERHGRRTRSHAHTTRCSLFSCASDLHEETGLESEVECCIHSCTPIQG
jgi:hypothetical protein